MTTATITIPKSLRSLYLTHEDQMEELQRELEAIQDKIFLLSNRIRPDFEVSGDGS